ncbi:hypothetical protein LWI29_022913 [Acer saccharum]|uniref:Transmembrane protein n=1 Tax=Acer saccharum TaxID=4024 RepID=A0AA39RSJ6_ACESA|nr:hypothetical protein LWI29_022913 [Acer saccharum]
MPNFKSKTSDFKRPNLNSPPEFSLKAYFLLQVVLFFHAFSHFLTSLISNFSHLSHFNDERLLHRELHDHHNPREYCDHNNHRDFVLEEPKNKAAYSSWSEKTFLKRSINVGELH